MVCSFRMMFFPLVLFFALGFSGCSALRPGAETDTASEGPPKGKVPVRYLVTNEDLESPSQGFIVWRSFSATGDFRRLNEEPIGLPADAGRGEVVTLLVDDDLPLGEEVYYYLERVGMDGSRSKATSVSRARVLLPESEQSRGERGASLDKDGEEKQDQS